MKIAIVILNWNGRALLETFLPSVVEHSANANIYLADNASTDASISYVRENYPQIRIIKNEQNWGYAQGYNEALKSVEEPLFCLLNSDVEVTSEWLDPILKEFENHPETSIVQPKILDYKRQDYFEYAGAAGGFIDKYGYPYCRGRVFDTLEKDEGQYDQPIELVWASGACFFIRKSCFEDLKGFDHSFFAHMEEIDLCWRAFNQGRVIKCLPESVVYHVGGATLEKTNSKKVYLNFRNSLFTLVKNAPQPVFLLVLVRLILDGVAGVRFLFQLKPKFMLAILKAHLHFYSKLPQLLKFRKANTQRQNYYKVNSVVLSYYVKNIKTFDCL